jgi:hypothetical protein
MSKSSWLAAAVFGLGALAYSQQSKFEVLKDWVCRVFQFDPKVYQRVVGVREGHQQAAGSRVMVVDLPAKSVTLLADCHGMCWSAAVAGKRIVIVKEDGIWEMEARAELHRAIAASGVEMIIGSFRNDSSLIILRTGESTSSCPHTLALADLVSGGILPAPEGAPKCLGDTDIGGLARPGTVRGNRVLRTTPNSGEARRLLIEELPKGDAAGSGPRRALLPWIDEQDDGIERFDAVWLDDTHVIFLEK